MIEGQQRDDSDHIYRELSKGGDVVIQNKNAILSIDIGPEHYKDAKSLCFSSVTFSGTVRFRNIDFRGGLHLHGCTFRQQVIFQNCDVSASRLTGLGYHEGHAILIDHSEFQAGLEMNAMILDKALSFHESIIHGFYLSQITPGTELDIDHCKTDGRLVFDKIKLHGTLCFSNCEIESFSKLTEIKASDLLWEDNKVSNFVTISSINIANKFTLESNLHSEYFRCAGINAGKIEIFENEFKKSFEIHLKDQGNTGNYGSIGAIELEDQYHPNEIQLNFYGATVDKVLVALNPGFKGVLDIFGGQVKELDLSGINYGNITIGSMDIGALKLNDLTNKGSFGISMLDTHKDDPSSIIIQGSDLGTATFSGIEFPLFAKLQIEDSFLSEIKYADIRWFDVGQLNALDKRNLALQEKRDIFRQLKLASEKQGDRIQSLAFKANEFRLHQKVLSDELWDQCHSIFDKTFADEHRVHFSWSNFTGRLGEQISLLFSRWTNDYGQNWLLPFVWTFLITALAYVAMIISITPTISWASWFGNDERQLLYTSFLHHSPAWPQLFNPARYLERIFSPELVNGNFPLRIIDLVHRVALGFLIYQIITAFRKYFK